jgi:hypothetical protein
MQGTAAFREAESSDSDNDDFERGARIRMPSVDSVTEYSRDNVDGENTVQEEEECGRLDKQSRDNSSLALSYLDINRNSEKFLSPSPPADSTTDGEKDNKIQNIVEKKKEKKEEKKITKEDIEDKEDKERKESASNMPIIFSHRDRSADAVRGANPMNMRRPDALAGWLMKRARSMTGIGFQWKRR